MSLVESLEHLQISSSTSSHMQQGTKTTTKKKKAINYTSDEDPDIDVIHGRKRVGKKCGNMGCYARASETKLKACARCKIVFYCSKECQTTDWKKHKPICLNNEGHIAELAKADSEGANTFYLPEGMSHVELDQILEKWVKFQQPLLMAATIHALGLPRDLKRSHSYLLRVKVSYRPDHHGHTGKMFRVDDAAVIAIEEALKLGKVWELSIAQIASVREESEKARRGTVAAICLECEPLAMQIVPFGSLRDLSPLRIQKEWKEILKRNVETGKKFTRFE